jgi:small subunit ribosomal protein S16
MLAIRLQRTGRSGHAQFRVIVQDSRFNPKRGRVVTYLGSYDPHTKKAEIDSVKTAQYLENGARPSDSAARLLKKEGVKLPAWVKLAEPKKKETRNADKRRSTRPPEPAAAEPEATEQPTVEPAASDKAPASDEATAAREEDAPADETAAPEASASDETPAEPSQTETSVENQPNS